MERPTSVTNDHDKIITKDTEKKGIIDLMLGTKTLDIQKLEKVIDIKNIINILDPSTHPVQSTQLTRPIQSTLADTNTPVNILNLTDLKFNDFIQEIQIIRANVKYYMTEYEEGNQSVAKLLEYWKEAAGKINTEVLHYKYYLQIASDAGHVNSTFHLAEIYRDGNWLSTQNDLQEAFSLYTMAANKGHLNALIKLSDFYKNGICTTKNYSFAMILLKMACALGSGHAMYKLALEHRNGVMAEKNMEISINYYKKAVAYDSENAMNDLGLLYLHGRPPYIEKNVALAVMLFEMATKHGCVQSFSHLASIYHKGHSNMIPENKILALSYFSEGVKLKDPVAMICLADYYIKGIGVTKDIEKGIELLKNSIKWGSYSGIYCLAVAYEEKNDIENALRYYKKGCELKDTYSLCKMGNLKTSGKYGPQDLDEAIKLFTLASELGYLFATFNLALIYGNLFPKNEYEKKYVDYQKAIPLLRKSLKAGIYKSCILLGKIYSEGYHSTNGEPDFKEAQKLFLQAESHGILSASHYLGMLYTRGSLGNDLIKKGLEYFEQAAKRGYFDSFTALANLYANGIPGVIEKNYIKALRLFRKAAGLGSRYAIKRLANYHELNGHPKRAAKLLEKLA